MWRRTTCSRAARSSAEIISAPRRSRPPSVRYSHDRSVKSVQSVVSTRRPRYHNGDGTRHHGHARPATCAVGRRRRLRETPARAPALMRRMRIPRSAEDITPDWMAEALHAGCAAAVPRMVGLRRTVIGNEKGFLSQTLRIELDYVSPPPDGIPVSVVTKIEPEAPSLRDAERRSNAFDREIGFYREIAPRVPMRVPRVYYADSSADGKVLVMEDLCSYQAADQLHGL